MRADSFATYDVPKIHCKDPIDDNHSVSFEHLDLWIPLQLNGVFSNFRIRVPSTRELHEYEKLFLNPDSSNWNPQCRSYEINEQSMIVFEGNLCKPSWRSKHQVVFEDEDDEMTDLASTMSSVFASVWEANIDTNV